MEFIFGIVIGIFITIVGLLIGAAAGPDDEFNEFKDLNDDF